MNLDLALDLSMLQTEFTTRLVILANKHNVDANNLMKQAIFSFNVMPKDTDFNKSKKVYKREVNNENKENN